MPYLNGERIVLRDYRLEDLSHIRKWVNDREITGTLHDVFNFPQTLHDSESFLKMMMESGSSTKGFVIAERESHEYIGQIDLHHIDWKNRCATMGIVIGRQELLGKGYGHEAIELLKDFVFNTINLHRLELDVYENNPRAYSCYLKSGFVEEGRLRKKLYRDGQYWDIIQMGLLREDYK